MNYLYTIIETINSLKLDYCIQNGYKNMPESYPTDIDIFYRNVSEKKLDEIVKTVANNAGLKIIQKVAMGYYHFVYWLTPELPEPGFQLELDFQSELSRKSMPHYYIPTKLLDRKIKYKNFYIPYSTDEIIYTILRRTVKNNFTTTHLETVTRAYQSNPVVVERELKEELPQSIVDIILSIISKQSTNVFEEHYDILYAYVCQVSKKNSTMAKFFRQWYYNITRMLPLRFFQPGGMDIALLAPDGGGKSTILEALRQYEIPSFAGVERKYIRPGLFKNIGQYKPNAEREMTDNPNPHGRKPDCIIKSGIRFFIYLIDFTLGYYIKIVPLKWQRKLIVFDRYYYDYYVDMYRYHYSLPKWFPRLFAFMIPSPTLTFVLYAPANIIYNRKRELTFEETQRQCLAFKNLCETLPNAVVGDVNRPIEFIVKDIVSKILKKQSELTKRKLK